ncbi:hypothetical protein M408DRAFT_75509 [Serendipita vermifera MAFF 305830]|uniref:Uncharacterized protein n=1 Tax=Serendipita vermifera MAFF 305830 TaxID=933852 RepID=A0A0C3AZJ7_SERVB|nr:hypothetical protein M408DRAFT_75509 [Serendipita vermifera MAFF 305830]
MNTDRRSGYSQNYAQDYSTTGPSAHAPNESAVRRPSRELLTGGNRDSQYNTSPRNQTFNAAENNDDPESGWNVYSDFNNAGPRYSSIKATTDGYQALPSPSVKLAAPPIGPPGTDAHNPVELVTVPALGAEWKAEELQAMSKKGKKEEKSYARGEKWKAWRRDQIGICGSWGTRKGIVWGLFIFICILGLVLVFTLPRTPGVYVDRSTPLVNTTLADDPGPKFGRFPATFTFNASLSMRIDTGGNFLPLKFNNLHAQIANLDTSQVIATGDLGPYTVPAKAYAEVLLPLSFNYTAANDTDTTWAAVYNACRNKNQFQDGIRPGIGLSIALYMDIAGLVTKPATSATISEAPCPFELPSTA